MDRRTFLSASGGAIAAGVSGCLEGVLTDEGGSFDRISRWTIPAPDQDDGSALASYGILSISPSKQLQLDGVAPANRSSLDRAPESYVDGAVDPSSVELEVTVSPFGAVDFPSYKVLEGSFSSSAVRDALDESNGKPAETHEGYDLYEEVTDLALEIDTTLERAFALGDGAVMQVGGVTTHEASLEDARTVVDARVGSADRFIAQHDGFRRTAARLDPGLLCVLKTEDPSGSVERADQSFSGVTASGTHWRRLGDEIEVRHVLTFERADAVEAETVAAFAAELRESSGAASVEHSTDGPVATVTATTSIQDYFQE